MSHSEELTNRHRELGLIIVAILAAGISVNFFILGTAGLLPFLAYRNYILIPSFFIILFAAAYGYEKNKRFANRLVTGLGIGIVATLALEAIRIPSISVHWIPHDDMIALPGKLLTNPPSIQDFQAMVSHHYNEGKAAVMQQLESDNMKMKDSMNTESVPNTSFKTTVHNSRDTMNEGSKMSMPNNGTTKPSQSVDTMMMKDSMQPSNIELAVGGLYHFWNGATMAAVYTLVLGRGKWFYGVVWGFIIHMGMMLAPWMIPMVGPFGINYGPGYTIFIVSLLAHLAYGAVVGILAQRFVKDKVTLVNIVRSKETEFYYKR